jgi:hypothetical protein
MFCRKCHRISEFPPRKERGEAVVSTCDGQARGLGPAMTRHAICGRSTLKNASSAPFLAWHTLVSAVSLPDARRALPGIQWLVHNATCKACLWHCRAVWNACLEDSALQGWVQEGLCGNILPSDQPSAHAPWCLGGLKTHFPTSQTCALSCAVYPVRYVT